MSISWHDFPSTCSHENDNVCPFCDFDRYYANKYPEECPWSELRMFDRTPLPSSAEKSEK